MNKPQLSTFILSGVLLYGGLILTGATLDWLSSLLIATATLLAYIVFLRGRHFWSEMSTSRLAATILSQVLLAGLAVAGGRGMLRMTGPLDIGIWIGPLLAWLGIGLSRLVWSGQMADRLHQDVDDALAELRKAQEQMNDIVRDDEIIAKDGDE